ncbi:MULTISPECIES: thiamine phosphate synthase [unclassified Mesorhizobium]|uniref:thiamine phosphate synthase n=1 Tax=unclassified Mesorhizobium TaxID=325217 RepID=UPI0030148B6F
MTEASSPNRCRIVLIAPSGEKPDHFVERLRQAIAGGDIASIILPPYDLDEASFQAFAEKVVPVAQEAGIAAIIADDTRAAGRVGADGLHLETKKAELEEAIEHYQQKMMVGAGGAKTRDDALELGELRPDYIFFGRFGYDNKPEPHNRNLSLGQWWAEVIEIPCIVLAGSDVASVEAVAATGAEFVALSSAVFGDGVDPKDAIARANAILDETAPSFLSAGN